MSRPSAIKPAVKPPNKPRRKPNRLQFKPLCAGAPGVCDGGNGRVSIMKRDSASAARRSLFLDLIEDQIPRLRPGSARPSPGNAVKKPIPNKRPRTLGKRAVDEALGERAETASTAYTANRTPRFGGSFSSPLGRPRRPRVGCKGTAEVCNHMEQRARREQMGKRDAEAQPGSIARIGGSVARFTAGAVPIPRGSGR